jgi:protein-disulfide isomerase
MRPVYVAVLAVLLLAAAPTVAQSLPDRVLGNKDAPVTMEEFVSLTCSHCAEFYTKVLPELQTRYIDTGKVKLVMRDFPLDGVALKAAALARCMPENQFHPFIKVLYANQAQWAFGGGADQQLIQYAKLGGLPGDKAQACLNDSAMMDAIAAGREAAVSKYNIQSTPTFVLNGGVSRISGARPVSDFATEIDALLAKHGK